MAQAFDAALVEAGGTLPVWLTLLSVKSSELANQRELAGMIGIQGATLTHHLNAMEAQGLLTRRRDPDNRRVHLVELTEAGEAMFVTLRAAALVFDKRLRAGLPDEQAGGVRRGAGLRGSTQLRADVHIPPAQTVDV